jgi:DNA-binding CsgD family transcriptional regulator
VRGCLHGRLAAAAVRGDGEQLLLRVLVGVGGADAAADGRLADRAALRKAVADAVSDRQRMSIVPLANEAGQVSLVAVTPLRQPGGARMALVLFDTRQTDHGALRLHFFKAHALTRSESLIACEVLNGKTPTEMAQSTGLSLATVRSYLKQIMAKTNTHRQKGWALPLPPVQARPTPAGFCPSRPGRPR